ncbi:MAG TPA: hypothetical protein VK142_07720 [Bacillota bacterium]|nr:hypothetical protein [Bacillota bacterium]
MNDTMRTILLAGAFISFILGAGTATGQEILQFFVSFGYLGIGVIIIAAILHAWFGAYSMDVGLRLKAHDSKDVFVYFCGKYIGTFMYWFSQIFILIVFITMISGAGATVAEHFTISEGIGRLIMGLAVLITALLRLESMVKILGIAGPIIVFFAIIVGGGSIDAGGLSQLSHDLEKVDMPQSTSYWWQSGFVYSSFVLLVAVPFLANLGKNETRRKNVIVGGILGGIIMLLGVFAIYIGVLSDFKHMKGVEIPTLLLANEISVGLGHIFSIILLIAIYTTAVGMLWTVSTQISKENQTVYKLVTVTLVIIGFFGGMLPFASIIDFVYPIVGYISLILFIGMFYRQFINPGALTKADNKVTDESVS